MIRPLRVDALAGTVLKQAGVKLPVEWEQDIANSIRKVILFDAAYAPQVRDYMFSCGYTVESFGQGNHDVYEKKPVYNFEMNRALYGTAYNNNCENYYQDIKSRLIRNGFLDRGDHISGGAILAQSIVDITSDGKIIRIG